MIDKRSSSIPFSSRSRLWVVLTIGTFLTMANCYWMVLAEAMFRTIHMTVQSIAMNAIFFLFFLNLINMGLKRVMPRAVLNKSDLLLIYAMVCMGSTVSGHGFMQLLIAIMTYVHWFASPENDWANLIWGHLPPWMTVTDKEVLASHYKGESSFYLESNLQAWTIPILAWSAFIFSLILVMLMINVIMRRQWVESEKLTYPIIQLPLRMIDNPAGLFGCRLLWIGFAIAGGLDILNELHHIYPIIPGINLKLHDLSGYFTGHPWSGIGWFPISLYPFVIGLGFLIPLDLLFSCWFFHLLWKVQRIVIFGFSLSTRGGSYAGYQSMIEQSTGGYLSLCLIALWVSRRHIYTVLKVSLSLEQLDQSREPISHRTALFWLSLGFLFLVGFSVAAGMSVWLAVVFFVIYTMISVAVTRMRVEMGTPVHDIHYGGPDLLIPPTVGTRQLGARNLTILGMYSWFNRTRYSDAMPHQLEGFKMAERTNTNNRWLLFVILLAIFVSIFATFWAFLHSSYQMGMLNSHMIWPGREGMERLQKWLTQPLAPSASTPISISTGMISTLLLALMRMRFLWWPFHPAGYAVSNSWGMSISWFPLFIAWVIKGLILRHGGLKQYRKLVPFFMGLMLGEFMVGGFLCAFGTLTGKPVYSFWPY